MNTGPVRAAGGAGATGANNDIRRPQPLSEVIAIDRRRPPHPAAPLRTQTRTHARTHAQVSAEPRPHTSPGGRSGARADTAAVRREDRRPRRHTRGQTEILGHHTLHMASRAARRPTTAL